MPKKNVMWSADLNVMIQIESAKGSYLYISIIPKERNIES